MSWIHSLLCGRKTSNPPLAICQHFSKGWTLVDRGPRLLAVWPLGLWDPGVLYSQGLLHQAWQGAATQTTLESRAKQNQRHKKIITGKECVPLHFIHPNPPYAGLPVNLLSAQIWQRQDGEGRQAQQGSSSKFDSCVYVLVISLHKDFMPFGWVDLKSVSTKSHRTNEGGWSGRKALANRGCSSAHCPATAGVSMSSIWTLIESSVRTVHRRNKLYHIYAAEFISMIRVAYHVSSKQIY